TAVATPGSPQYRRFLTPTPFRQQFAPSPAPGGAGQQGVGGRGFPGRYTPAHNHHVGPPGTAAHAAPAFGPDPTNYPGQGRTPRAPDRLLSVPDALAGTVAAVVGLDDSAALVHTNQADAPPSPAFVNAPPCSAYWAEKSSATTPGADGTAIPPAYGTAQPWAPCGYTPSQLQGGYGVASAIAARNGRPGQ